MLIKKCKVEVKQHIKWCRAVNSIYFLCFYYYELILSTSHDVNVEPSSFTFLPHFFSSQRLINMKMYEKQLYANVEDLLE